LKLLADADEWQFLSSMTLIFYIFCPLFSAATRKHTMVGQKDFKGEQTNV